jgi:hypothetical protein
VLQLLPQLARFPGAEALADGVGDELVFESL